jgi:tetratricopeptide (TPR) repeat protein
VTAPDQPAAPLDPRTDRARRHFEDGNAAYAAGRYDEALAEFTAGHALVPRPSFLLNLAQTHRKLGQLELAKERYLDFLRTLPDDSPLRPQIAQIALDIDLELRNRPPGDTRPPEGKSKDLVLTDPFTGPVLPPQAAGGPTAGRTKTRVGLVLLAGGAAVMGVGVAFEVLAKQAGDRLSALEPGDRFDRTTEQRGKRYDVLGIAALVTGGLAAGVGTGLLLMGRGEAAEASRLSTYVAPTAGGALLGARIW